MQPETAYSIVGIKPLKALIVIFGVALFAMVSVGIAIWVQPKASVDCGQSQLVEFDVTYSEGRDISDGIVTVTNITNNAATTSPIVKGKAWACESVGSTITAQASDRLGNVSSMLTPTVINASSQIPIYNLLIKKIR